MKLVLWVMFGIAALGLAAWVVTAPGPPTGPLAFIFLVGLFGVPPLGAFWMLYQVIRHEKNPGPLMLLAFIPFTFLWYYFERVRPGKHKTRMPSVQAE